MQLYSNVLGSIPNLSKNCEYLIKFELSTFVNWSGPVDKVAVFQIVAKNFRKTKQIIKGLNPASANQ